MGDTINCYKNEQLDFKNLSSLPSAAAKRKEIIRLYDSIQTGSSTCHQTGNEKKASGGWYSFNCVHGVIYASTLLFHSESTRDPADLWLSLKFKPVVTIVDTSCTLSSHLVLREPIKGKLWFGDRLGGFEPATEGVLPKIVSIPELKVR